MAYDWEGAEDGGGGPKLDPGIYQVTGTKVVNGKGAKGDWVMLVVEDEATGGEASTVFTLTDKAAWTLARWLSRCGVDLKAMKAEGVDPQHFSNKDIAAQYLVGKTCWCRVSLGQNPKYRDLEPIKEEEARAEAPHLFASAPVRKEKPADPNDPLNRHGPNCAHTIEDLACDKAECAGCIF